MPERRKALLESGHFTPINEDWMTPIVEGLEAGQKMRQIERENPFLWVALVLGFFVTLPAFGQRIPPRLTPGDYVLVWPSTNKVRRVAASVVPPALPTPHRQGERLQPMKVPLPPMKEQKR